MTDKLVNNDALNSDQTTVVGDISPDDPPTSLDIQGMQEVLDKTQHVEPSDTVEDLTKAAQRIQKMSRNLIGGRAIPNTIILGTGASAPDLNEPDNDDSQDDDPLNDTANTDLIHGSSDDMAGIEDLLNQALAREREEAQNAETQLNLLLEELGKDQKSGADSKSINSNDTIAFGTGLGSQPDEHSESQTELQQEVNSTVLSPEDVNNLNTDINNINNRVDNLIIDIRRGFGQVASLIDHQSRIIETLTESLNSANHQLSEIVPTLKEHLQITSKDSYTLSTVAVEIDSIKAIIQSLYTQADPIKNKDYTVTPGCSDPPVRSNVENKVHQIIKIYYQEHYDKYNEMFNFLAASNVSISDFIKVYSQFIKTEHINTINDKPSLVRYFIDNVEYIKSKMAKEGIKQPTSILKKADSLKVHEGENKDKSPNPALPGNSLHARSAKVSKFFKKN